MLLLHHTAIKWSARMDLHHRSPKATGLQPVSIAALTLADERNGCRGKICTYTFLIQSQGHYCYATRQ